MAINVNAIIVIKSTILISCTLKDALALGAQNLIHAIFESNTTRKDFIDDEIIRRNPKVVGFYRLIMKAGSDNFRAW